MDSSTISKSEVIHKIFFNSLPYCILRNYSDLPDSTLGGDIDLIINPNLKERWANHLQFVSSFYDLDMGVIQTHDHGIRYCIFSVKKSFFIKLDFHYGEYWRGMEYLSADQILDSSILYNGFSVPSNTNEAVLSLLAPLITSGKTRSKYENIVIDSVNQNKSDFIDALHGIVGISLARDITYYIDNGKYTEISILSNRVRWNLWFRMFFKSCGGTLLSIHKYLIYEFQRRNSLLGYLLILDGEDEDIKRFLKLFLQKSKIDFPGIGVNSEAVHMPHKFTSPVDSVLKKFLQSYNIVICSSGFLGGSVTYKSTPSLKKQKILMIGQDKVVMEQGEYPFNEAIKNIYVEVLGLYVKKY